MTEVILDKERGSILGLDSNDASGNSGYDVKCIGYSKVTPIFEELDNGIKVLIDGKIEQPIYFDDNNKFVVIMPNDTLLLKTGVRIAQEGPSNLAEGVNIVPEIQSRPRSGLSLKMGLNVHLGTIDSNYRGDIGIIATNINKFPIKINNGERVGQLVFSSVWKLEEGKHGFKFVEEFSEEAAISNRGAAGYGNSGK